VALLATAEGEAVVRETIYDGRMGYAYELVKMGADIRVDGNTAYVRGVERLTGAPVQALDIRAGAAVVIAGLVAEGETRIVGVEHLDRKYEGLERKLQAVGAEVRRVSETEVAVAGT